MEKSIIISLAMDQLSKDYNFQIDDLKGNQNILVENSLIDGRRVYGSDGCFLKILSVRGINIFYADPSFHDFIKEKLLKRDGSWIFHYQNLKLLNKELQKFGHEIADIHQYYLPMSTEVQIKKEWRIKWFEQEDILAFRGDKRFREAYAFSTERPDMLGVAAIEGDQIMGMAGASADGEKLWQIGIDVMAEYRGQGVGTMLVYLLKEEILKRSKVPFYGTVSSHMNSQNIAMNAGFFPAWAELYTERIKGE